MEPVENKELITSNDEETQITKKRGRRIGRRKKRVEDISSSENIGNNLIASKTDDDPITLPETVNTINPEVTQKAKPNKQIFKKNKVQVVSNNENNEQKKSDENTKTENIKKNIKKAVTKINKNMDVKNNIEEPIKSSVLDNGKITTLREVKTSSPIDIVTIDEASKKKKP